MRRNYCILASSKKSRIKKNDMIKSLPTIGELQRIQESATQTEAKDNKTTEMFSEVERLKQALNSLSQLTYSGAVPP